VKERYNELIILCSEFVFPIFTKFRHLVCGKKKKSGHELGARPKKASYNRMQLLRGAERIPKTETLLSKHWHNKHPLFYLRTRRYGRVEFHTFDATYIWNTQGDITRIHQILSATHENSFDLGSDGGGKRGSQTQHCCWDTKKHRFIKGRLFCTYCVVKGLINMF
jgi:hypothetical protein